MASKKLVARARTINWDEAYGALPVNPEHEARMAEIDASIEVHQVFPTTAASQEPVTVRKTMTAADWDDCLK